MVHTPVLLAQAAQGPGNFLGNPLVLILGLFVIMYFMMIRPQQKQAREHRELLAGLKKGDDVVTQGGMFGKIHAVTDKIVTLEVANGVRLRVLKSSIQGKSSLGEEASAAPKAEEKKEEK